MKQHMPDERNSKRLDMIADLMVIYMDADYKSDFKEMANVEMYIKKLGGTVE